MGRFLKFKLNYIIVTFYKDMLRNIITRQRSDWGYDLKIACSDGYTIKIKNSQGYNKLFILWFY